MRGWRNYSWKPHRDRLAKQNLSQASIHWYMREQRRGMVSSNSRSQTVLFQQHSANLSIYKHIYIYIYRERERDVCVYIYIVCVGRCTYSGEPRRSLSTRRTPYGPVRQTHTKFGFNTNKQENENRQQSEQATSQTELRPTRVLYKLYATKQAIHTFTMHTPGLR